MNPLVLNGGMLAAAARRSRAIADGTFYPFIEAGLEYSFVVQLVTRKDFCTEDSIVLDLCHMLQLSKPNNLCIFFNYHIIDGFRFQ